MIAGAAHGGAETFSMDAVIALHERRVGQFVLCRRHEIFLGPLRDAGIPFETLTFARWKKRHEQEIIRRGVASYSPDLIHCWMTRTAEFMPKGTGVPVLGWSGGDFKMKYFGACDYYMGITSKIFEALKEQTGRPDRVFLGHTFGTLPDDVPLSRLEFNIPEGMPVILMLTRMHQIKGVDLLLHAALELNAFLLLVGDGPELENYRDLARKLGIESRVCFTGWRNNRSALLELADVLAFPSRGDSFGTVMVEAWSKNVPVVAARADGPSQYIEHGVNGMLSEIGDVDGLERNLRAVLEDADLRERLIVEGVRTYEATFSRDVVVSKLVATYEEIIRRGVPA